MEKARSPWSVPVSVEDIPETGLHVQIEPNPEIRVELAKLANVRELLRMSCTFDLTPQGASVRVAGDVKARVGQTCVVTLDPVDNDVDEHVELVFAPESKAMAEAKAADGEPPEPLIGGQLDLGAIATEFLLLGIDPYPRKAHAEFTSAATADGTAKPFAALEVLKKRLGGG